ncbi:hypothetical protein E2C01_015453 [Portunus trituberculatus]|uniref:Uncharacterized protein n=1 Tax=Portunus trituberculatus TaxID=210409 RepID=A0A5B7DLX0_PORTR|nr:hypothetical protein [Portunus trituberculatus]
MDSLLVQEVAATITAAGGMWQPLPTTGEPQQWPTQPVNQPRHVMEGCIDTNVTRTAPPPRLRFLQ